MVEISRKYLGKQRTFEILTVVEANERGLTLVPWREAQVGDYAITDDNYVMQCLDIFEMGKYRAEVMNFEGGRAIRKQKRPFLFGERLATRDWWSITPLSWQKKEAKKARGRLTIKAYARQIVEKKVDFVVLGQMYRPDQEIPEATVRRFLKQEEVQSVVAEEVAKILKDQGIDPSSVVQVVKDAIEVARKKGDSGNMLRGAENFIDMLQMKPQVSKSAMPPEVPMLSDADFAAISAAEAQYTLPEVKDEP